MNYVSRKLALTAGLLLAVTAAFAQADSTVSKKRALTKTISVSPATLSFNLDKGGENSQIITVRNTTDTKQSLILEFSDWSRDSIGKHVFTPIGSSGHSCSQWVTFDKPFLELESGQNATVTVTMKVPDSDSAVSEMKWSMLIIRTVEEQRAPVAGARMEAIINKSFGLGVHVYQTPPNVTHKEVKMLGFDALNKGQIYRITSKNVGSTQLACKFSLELSSIETGKKTVLNPQLAPLFPEQRRVIDFKLPADLPKGRYTAIALIDAGDDEVPVEAAQKEIVIN